MDDFEDDSDEDFDQTTSLSTQGRFPEKLIRVRSEAGDRSFLVRWEGFDEDSDSWVHESALSSRLVDEYDWGTMGLSVPERDTELECENDDLSECERENDENEDYTPFTYTPLTPEELEREVRLLNERFKSPPSVSVEVVKVEVKVVKDVSVIEKSVQLIENAISTPPTSTPTSKPKKIRHHPPLKTPRPQNSPKTVPPVVLTETQRQKLHSCLLHSLWLSKVKRLTTFTFKPPKPPRPPPDTLLSPLLSSTLSSPPSQLLGFSIPDRSSVVTVENQCGFVSLLLCSLFSSVDSPLEHPPPHFYDKHFPRLVVCP